jgi:hypothetical protein
MQGATGMQAVATSVTQNKPQTCALRKNVVFTVHKCLQTLSSLPTIIGL